MVIDIGRALACKAELNKACMIAAEEASKCIDIEAAQDLGINKLENNYSGIIYEYFDKNYVGNSSTAVTYLNHRVVGSVNNPKYIEVYCEAKISCIFLKIIGIDHILVHTKAHGRLRRIK